MLERSADDAVDDPAEAAGHRINLAWVLLRRGASGDVERVHGVLAAARSALADAPPSARVTVLSGWADVVESSAALAGDRSATELTDAASRCEPWTAATDAELAAWASACVAQVARRRGDRVRAADFFDLALLHHEHLRLGAEQARAPMGPGERADLFYRAARVASEQGEVDRAWDVLSRLDALASGLEQRRRCRDSAAEDVVDAWRALDDEAAELFARLAGLDGPAAGASARIRDTQRRAAKERLREIFESRPGCGARPAEPSGADVKLFALDGEVWALWRVGDGFRAVRRPLGDVDLGATTRALDGARAARDVGDGEWRRLAEPVARILLPLLEQAGAGDPNRGPLRLSLHGPLQQIPFAALPLPNGDYWGTRFLTPPIPASTPVVGDAAADRSAAPSAADSRGVIVLDPLGDLAGTRRQLPFYRGLTAAPVLV
ncbi:MAG: hypothetical protein AAFY88_25810, partial [Acidobacteriota bacterium]